MNDIWTFRLKDNWWFIGAQLGTGMNDSQDQENGSVAKDEAL